MLTILIVDDSKSARMALEAVLSPYGKCRLVKNGKEAVECVESALKRDRLYDLIMMDIEMPEMDGHVATRTIRSLLDAHQVPPEKRPKVVMVSSMKDSHNIMKAQFEDPVDIYITKPFQDQTIIEALVNLELIETPWADDECIKC